MAHTHAPARRQFLRLSAALAALGTANLALGRSGRVLAAEFGAGSSQAPLQDYKALVCIYLFGGNDGNNTIVPVDNTRYAAYQSIRGGLALSGAKLLPPIADAAGNPYALHYGLPEVQSLYAAGQVAFVLNAGMLQQPLTRSQYLQGLNTPSNLFSHSDQTVQAQTGMAVPNGTGWGGRLLDCFGNGDTLAGVSMAAPALFLQGYDVGGNALPPGATLKLSGMNFWPQSEANARRQAVTNLLGVDGGNTIRNEANRAFSDGLQLADALQNVGGVPGGVTFPGTQIGNQLKDVARLISLRSQGGPGRQVFFCSLGGFDLHSSQDWTHWYLLSSLSQALGAFQAATQAMGLASHVTAFTQSEFGRSLQPSGTGTDHAWGSHQMVIGGGVKGGIYGKLPTLALGGPDDANTRGVWIPTISTAQFGGTLGRWFGATPDQLAWAFPNLAAFPTSDLGFMQS
jgi:uncharacterized protein (DUF1501 family)